MMELHLNYSKILKTAKEVDLGFEVRNVLKQLPDGSVSDLDILRFRNDCRTAIITALKKIFERSPLKYCFTRYVSCLSPELIARNATVASKRMKYSIEY